MDNIKEIQERNKRVEMDKAWETSWTRRLCIAAITYGLAYFFMWNARIPDPAISACIPTGGYLLSTLSLSFVKKWWVKKYQAAVRSDLHEVKKPAVSDSESVIGGTENYGSEKF